MILMLKKLISNWCIMTHHSNMRSAREKKSAEYTPIYMILYSVFLDQFWISAIWMYDLLLLSKDMYTFIVIYLCCDSDLLILNYYLCMNSLIGRLTTCTPIVILYRITYNACFWDSKCITIFLKNNFQRQKMRKWIIISLLLTYLTKIRVTP